MKCIKLRYYKQKMGSGTKPTGLMKSPWAGTRRWLYLNAEDLGSFTPINCKGHNFSILALCDKRPSLLSYLFLSHDICVALM